MEEYEKKITEIRKLFLQLLFNFELREEMNIKRFYIDRWTGIRILDDLKIALFSFKNEVKNEMIEKEHFIYLELKKVIRLFKMDLIHFGKFQLSEKNMIILIKDFSKKLTFLILKYSPYSEKEIAKTFEDYREKGNNVESISKLAKMMIYFPDLALKTLHPSDPLYKEIISGLNLNPSDNYSLFL